MVGNRAGGQGGERAEERNLAEWGWGWMGLPAAEERGQMAAGEGGAIAQGCNFILREWKATEELQADCSVSI